VALSQEFPSGSTLRLNREKRQAEAEMERMRREIAIRDAALAVRLAWLHKFHASVGQSIIEENRQAVNELVDALSASYAQGKLTSQDVLRAELELSLLDDRLAELRQNEAVAEAELSRYIGPAAFRPSPGKLPEFAAPGTMDAMEAVLVRHPVALVDDATIAVEETEIGLAKQAYKPKWSLEGGYGVRGAERPDFASAGVRFSVPIFTGKRQDRALSAARKDKSAAELDRATTLLDLRRELVKTYADWVQLEKRLALYDAAVIQRAGEAADASVSAYGGGLADFPELIRSQLAELDAKLRRHDLRIQRAMAWARLAYLAGDDQ
jgi:outer membrane protein TolC